MNGGQKRNSMLIELIIVILFFSISVSIIMQLFVAASERSKQSEAENLAVFYAEDIAERFIASGEALDAFFADGWTQAGDGWERALDADGRALRMVAGGTEEETAAGTLATLDVTIYDGDRVAASLPVSRYIPGEGTP